MSRHHLLSSVFASALACPALASAGPDDAARASLDNMVEAQRALQAAQPESRTEAAPVVAAPDAASAADLPDAPGGVIGAVRIAGAAEVGLTLFQPAIEASIGQPLDRDTLARLASQIAQSAREQGYLFATAVVPAQTVKAGIVQVDFDPGVIADIRIVGSQNRRLASILAPLKGAAPTKAQLERLILLAGDIPGIRVASTRFAREGRRGILIVEVAERQGDGRVVADNYGPKAFGPVRARLGYDMHGLISDSDTLSVQILMTPTDVKELNFFSVRYAAMLDDAGTFAGIGLSVGRTAPGGQAAIYDLEGRTTAVSLFVSRPILRTRALSLWANLSGDLIQSEQERFGQLLLRDHVTSATLSLTGNARLAGGQLSGGIGVTQGLDLFGATKAGDVLASRSDGSGEFTRFNGWLNWFGALNKQMALRVALNGQIATRPLLASQEMGVGGPSFGRGYDFGERIGDNALMGLVELRHAIRPPVSQIKWMHVYAFADNGIVDNIGRADRDRSIASAGVGMRLNMLGLEMGIEGAFPLTDTRWDSGDKSPRINLIAGYSF